MTQEEKDLLLKDLCGRLPYGVKINCFDIPRILVNIDVDDGFVSLNCGGEHFYHPFNNEFHSGIKPYLRPMSSMTEEEREEFHHYASLERNYLGDDKFYTHYQMIDWLNAHYFDYRGLIEKGLSLEAPEEMYK